MSNWLNDIINEYYKFLKSKTHTFTQTGTDWSVISTPFVDLYNDNIEIFIKNEDDIIYLSDDGITLKNLEQSGVSVNRSIARNELLERVLISYGVSRDHNDELTVSGDIKSIPSKKHNLISAILEINDMYYVSKNKVLSVFKEEVKQFLLEMDMNFTPEFISKGSTGLEFTFDFQISTKKKEIVIKSFSQINKYTIANFLFTWEDIKTVREKVTSKEVHGLAFINNSEKPVKSEYLDALKSKNAEYILWNDRKQTDKFDTLLAS